MSGAIDDRRSAERRTTLVRRLAPDCGRLIDSLLQHDPRTAWRRTLLEIVLGFALIAACEALFFEGSIGSFGVHPHPYWLILLPVAAARGLLPGIVAAGIATFLFGLGVLTSPGAAGVTSVLDVLTMRDPILFFAVVYVVGELRDGLARRMDELAEGWVEVEVAVERLEHERDVLAEANRELERRIVDHPSQVTGLLQTAVRVGGSAPERVFEIALELVEEHCGGRATVVAVARDGRMTVVAPDGLPGDEELRRIDAVRESELCARALRLAVCVDGLREGDPGDGPLCVAPLLDGEGLLIALLCLDDVPTRHLNETTARVFFGVAEWISASLCRLERGAPPLGRSALIKLATPVERALGTPRELGERLRVEIERRRRHEVPVTVLGIRSRSTDAAWVEDVLLEQFGENLRATDGLYAFGYPGCFAACLAATSLEAAEAPLERVRELTRAAAEAGDVGPVHVFLLAPEEEDLEDGSRFVRTLARELNPAPLHDDRAPCPTDVRPTLGDAAACERRIDVETRLAQRMATSLCVLELEVSGGTAALHPELVEPALSTLVRRADGTYLIGDGAEDGRLLVVLPETDEDQAARIARRFETFLVEAAGAPEGSVRSVVRRIDHELGRRVEGLDDEGTEQLAVA